MNVNALKLPAMQRATAGQTSLQLLLHYNCSVFAPYAKKYYEMGVN